MVMVKVFTHVGGGGGLYALFYLLWPRPTGYMFFWKFYIVMLIIEHDWTLHRLLNAQIV